MGSNDHMRMTSFPTIHYGFPLCIVDVSSKQLHTSTKRTQTGSHGCGVLFCKHGSWCKNESLSTSRIYQKDSSHGHLSFPEAHISYNNAIHGRVAAGEVLITLVYGRCLVWSEPICERLIKLLIHLLRRELIRLPHALKALQVNKHLIHHQLSDVFFSILLSLNPSLPILNSRQLGRLHSSFDGTRGCKSIKLTSSFVGPNFGRAICVFNE
mmetsp:Transcript_12027/g.51776  ORF Transcript_12027/g.51776 Transcript_12027/m.51776 type:complete len:211 (-) Transcript_12027:1199-1831(-)